MKTENCFSQPAKLSPPTLVINRKNIRLPEFLIRRGQQTVLSEHLNDEVCIVITPADACMHYFARMLSAYAKQMKT